MTRVLPALVAFLVAGGAPDLAAQGTTTGAVRGRVVSAVDSGPVAGATVTVTSVSTGQVLSTRTREDGRYALDYVPVGGPYVLRVSRLGFAPAGRDSFRLALGQLELFDAVLAPQAVQLTGVQVAAGPAGGVIHRSRTGPSTTLDRRTLDNTPSLNRSFTDAVVISPYVSQAGGGASIGGQNNRYNNIQIDGAVNNDTYGLSGAAGVPGGQANTRPIPLDAIQEYQVLAAPFDVRYSGFTGGLLNAVTRSGTNTVNGSLYAYYRDQRFAGESNRVAAPEFQTANYGLTVGGPIVRDRLHYFVAAEFERMHRPSPGLNVGVDDPGTIGISTETAERIASAARDRYGVEPGDVGRYTLSNPLDNVFARLDYQISTRHRLALRHNFAGARNERPVNRSGGLVYAFGSYGDLPRNRTNSTALQLFSTLGNRFSNELLLNWQTIRDPRDPKVRYPVVEISVQDPVIPDAPARQVIMGAERFAHASNTDSDNLQLTNSLTGAFGAHRVTVGAHAEYFGFRTLFFPTSLGRYVFPTIEAFEQNRPGTYEVNTLLPGVGSVAKRWGTVQTGAYVQDEWAVSDRLTLTGGLRVDVPVMLDRPRENPAFRQAFGIGTGSIPSGNPLWSPRLAFNWTSLPARRTQVRGGIGTFSGRPPFVWINNAFANTGRETVMLTCSGAAAPPLTPADPAPQQCADGRGPLAGSAVVNYFDRDFRFPQEFKASLAVDRELPFGIVGTAEALYSRAINQIFVSDENIPADPLAVDPVTGRPRYGTPTASGFTPVRRSEGFNEVIRGSNRSENDALLLTAAVERTLLGRLALRGSYTFARVRDVQGLTGSIAASNFAGTPVGGDPNDPALATSDFDRPHKVVLSASARLFERLGGTDLTLLYVGQSGSPYSYVVFDDVNGDGYRGLKGGVSNDLVYVPRGTELTYASDVDRERFEQLIALEPCLREARGSIMARNSCRGPWTNSLDLRVAQTVGPGRARAQVIADVFNVLNLVSDDWGQVRTVARSQSVLRTAGRVGGQPTGDFIYRYVGRVEDDRAARPDVVSDAESRWQVRLGFRVLF